MNMKDRKWIYLLSVCVMATCMLTVNALAADGEEAVYLESTSEYADLSAWHTSFLQADTPQVNAESLRNEQYEQAKETIHQAIVNRQTSVKFSLNGWAQEGNQQEAISAVYYNTLFDYPEDTFFARTGWGAQIGDDGTVELMFLRLPEEEQDSDSFGALVDAACRECFAEGMTDLEKIVSAHDWIITHCEYDPAALKRGRVYLG